MVEDGLILPAHVAGLISKEGLHDIDVLDGVKTLSCVVFVLQVGAVRSVTTKTGRSISLSRLLVAQPEKNWLPVCLWAEHAAFAQTVNVGDVVFMFGLNIRWYRGRPSACTRRQSWLRVIQSSFSPTKSCPGWKSTILQTAAMIRLWGHHHHRSLLLLSSPTAAVREPHTQHKLVSQVAKLHHLAIGSTVTVHVKILHVGTCQRGLVATVCDSEDRLPAKVVMCG